MTAEDMEFVRDVMDKDNWYAILAMVVEKQDAVAVEVAESVAPATDVVEIMGLMETGANVILAKVVVGVLAAVEAELNIATGVVEEEPIHVTVVVVQVIVPLVMVEVW